MRRTLAAAFLALVATSFVGTGCSCDTYCDYEAERTQFTAELLAVDGTVLTFAAADGPIRVGVSGNEEFLHIGERYRVTAVRNVRTDVEWASHVNAGCGCRLINITHPDGVRVNTSFWARVPWRAIAVVVLAVPVAAIAGVTLNRVVRGRESDDEFLGTGDR